MTPSLLSVLDDVGVALVEGRTERARVLVDRARELARRGPAEGRPDTASADLARVRLLLLRTVRIVLARGVEPVATEILDAMLAVVEASRGFVGLTEPDGSWRLVVARNLEQHDIEDPASFVSSWIIGVALDTREPVVTADARTDDGASHSVLALDLRSVVCLPLVVGDEVIGFAYLDDPSRHGLFDAAAVAALTSWLPLVAQSITRAAREERETSPLPGVVTRSATMRQLLSELARVAAFDASILLTGETGTGKSLVAQQVHAASPRAGGPFVHVNCGALPESLIEAELFGAEIGAFSGAVRRRIGRFEAANGGTLFLDELDTMPMSCQVKLLVALQERRIQRLGSNVPIEVDVRVIAAMSREPFATIDAGVLREDLYYRLAVFVSHLPPLRDRPEDLPILARHLLERTRERYGLPPLRLSPEALVALLRHRWPGNVRELENALDRAALLATDGVITEIPLRTRAGAELASDDVVGALVGAAERLLREMDHREALRTPETADVFKSVLYLATARAKGKEEGFTWLGLEATVRSRNHTRVLRREAARLKAFCDEVEAPVPVDLTDLV